MINRVFLAGNIGIIETKTLENGTKVANVTLATTERAFTTSAGKEIPEKTQWHSLVFWRGLAELVEKYCEKGKHIAVSGKLVYEKYEKDGVARWSTKIEVDELDLGSKGSSSSAPQESASEAAPDIAPEPTNEEELPF